MNGVSLQQTQVSRSGVATVLLHLDWILFFATVPLISAGLITVNSFVSESVLFEK